MIKKFKKEYEKFKKEMLEFENNNSLFFVYDDITMSDKIRFTIYYIIGIL